MIYRQRDRQQLHTLRIHQPAAYLRNQATL